MLVQWVGLIHQGMLHFLLAIRGARCIEENIEFTAGSGIVSGSVLEKEIDEIN